MKPAFLNKIVAIRLITGHMIQKIIMEIAAVIAKGLSLDVTMRNAAKCATNPAICATERNLP